VASASARRTPLITAIVGEAALLFSWSVLPLTVTAVVLILPWRSARRRLRYAAAPVVLSPRYSPRGLHVHEQRHVVAEPLPVVVTELDADVTRDRVS